MCLACLSITRSRVVLSFYFTVLLSANSHAAMGMLGGIDLLTTDGIGSSILSTDPEVTDNNGNLGDSPGSLSPNFFVTDSTYGTLRLNDAGASDAIPTDMSLEWSISGTGKLNIGELSQGAEGINRLAFQTTGSVSEIRLDLSYDTSIYAINDANSGSFGATGEISAASGDRWHGEITYLDPDGNPYTVTSMTGIGGSAGAAGITGGKVVVDDIAAGALWDQTWLFNQNSIGAKLIEVDDGFGGTNTDPQVGGIEIVLTPSATDSDGLFSAGTLYQLTIDGDTRIGDNSIPYDEAIAGAVPEPSTSTLTLLGMLLLLRRKRP